MNKNLYAFFILCLVILGVSSCTGNHSPNTSHQDLYQNVVSWLNENTLDTDSIILPLIEKGNFGNRPVFNIPQSVDTFGVMDTVRTVKPEFVLTVNSIVWDGVIQQSWFQRRYSPVHVFYDTYDTLAPATLYTYRPSPFDNGQVISVTGIFEGLALNVSSFNINTTRIFPGKVLYITVNWHLETYRLKDNITLSLSLTSPNYDPVYILMEEFKPVFETFADSTSITTYHTIVVPADLTEGSYLLHLGLKHENGAPIPVTPSSQLGPEYLYLTTINYPQLVSNSDLYPIYPTEYHFLENNLPVISLSGFDIVTQTVAGNSLAVGFVWKTMGTPVGDYKVFIHLRDSTNSVIAQTDNKPLDWSYPTTQWQPDQVIYDEHMVAISSEIKRGLYTLYVGMYSAQTAHRMPIVHLTGDHLVNDEIQLCQIMVR